MVSNLERRRPSTVKGMTQAGDAMTLELREGPTCQVRSMWGEW